MLDQIVFFKKGTYSFERKLSNTVSCYSNEAETRKEYWENFISEGLAPFTEYLTNVHGYTSNLFLNLLTENKFDINDTVDLSVWNELISVLKDEKYKDIELPAILWKNAQGKWDNHPAFLTFFVPFLKVALGKIRESVVGNSLTLSNKVEKQVLTILLNQLMNLGYRTMILELNIAREENLLQGETSNEKYDYFNDTYLIEHFWDILDEYPVLFRLISTYINNWKNNINELLLHFKQDRTVINENFNVFGEIESVEGGLSDLHNGGKSVFIVTLEDGNKVVYKPRTLEIDELFQSFLSWFNESVVKTLHVTKLISFENHGWMEYIAHKPCYNESELESYYYELGCLLCILYIFRANDVHYENIIAHGAHPVLIDIETLFHNILVSIDIDTADGEITQLLERSVRRVGILPNLVWGKKGQKGVDISAIGGFEDQEVPIESISISNYSSDEMKIEYKTYNLQSAQNLPFIESKNADLSTYRGIISVGFEETYHFFSKNKKNLAIQLSKFKLRKVRHIVRATQFYSSLIHVSLHPDFLRSGLDREMLFSRLWKQAKDVKQLTSITPIELQECLNGDVPLFLTNTGSTHLYGCKGQIIENVFNKSGLDMVFEQVSNLGQTDFNLQKSFIDTSLEYDPDYNRAKSQPEIKLRIRKLSKIARQVEKEKYLTVARKIGDHLIDISFKGKNGDICWMDINVVGEKATDWNITPIGCDLYNGTSGIILFFIYLYKLTNDAKYFTIVKKCYNSIELYFEKRSKYNPTGENVLFGGYSGESPIIYALLTLGTELTQHFNMESLLSLCNIIINNMQNKIEQDQDYDILIGSAGLIRQLLNLYDVTRDEKLLQLSKRCASHLVGRAVDINEKSIGWKSALASNPLAGFAHGAAGISSTLARLYSYSPEQNYLISIEKALNYETSLFNPEIGNWADRRMTDEGTAYDDLNIMPVAWCHGAAGILLSRLEKKKQKLPLSIIGQIDRDINVALETTLHRGFGRSHCLCHGDLGNIEIINTAAKVLNRPELYDIASSYMATIIDDMLQGDWKCGISYTNSPGLMLGLSGIGYGLLKLCDDSINSVLTLELRNIKNGK